MKLMDACRRFGNNKVNYTCSACALGTFKFLDTPTACTSCEAGRYTDQVGNWFIDFDLEAYRDEEVSKD